MRVELRLPHRRPICVTAARSDDLYVCITEAFELAARALTSAESRERARRRQEHFGGAEMTA